MLHRFHFCAIFVVQIYEKLIVFTPLLPLNLFTRGYLRALLTYIRFIYNTCNFFNIKLYSYDN